MESTSIAIKTGHDLPFEQVVDLYNVVGWLAYTNAEQRPKLQEALRNSTYVVTAWHAVYLTMFQSVICRIF